MSRAALKPRSPQHARRTKLTHPPDIPLEDSPMTTLLDKQRFAPQPLRSAPECKKSGERKRRHYGVKYDPPTDPALVSSRFESGSDGKRDMSGFKRHGRSVPGAKLPTRLSPGTLQVDPGRFPGATAGKSEAWRTYRSFADNLPNGKIAGGAASLTTTSCSTFLSVTRKLAPGRIR